MLQLVLERADEAENIVLPENISVYRDIPQVPA
jgi:hypothetical protein